jgi:hypothetical protein
MTISSKMTEKLVTSKLQGVGINVGVNNSIEVIRIIEDFAKTKLLEILSEYTAADFVTDKAEEIFTKYRSIFYPRSFNNDNTGPWVINSDLLDIKNKDVQSSFIKENHSRIMLLIERFIVDLSVTRLNVLDAYMMKIIKYALDHKDESVYNPIRAASNRRAACSDIDEFAVNGELRNNAKNRKLTMINESIVCPVHMKIEAYQSLINQIYTHDRDSQPGYLTYDFKYRGMVHAFLTVLQNMEPINQQEEIFQAMPEDIIHETM